MRRPLAIVVGLALLTWTFAFMSDTSWHDYNGSFVAAVGASLIIIALAGQTPRRT